MDNKVKDAGHHAQANGSNQSGNKDTNDMKTTEILEYQANGSNQSGNKDSGQECLESCVSVGRDQFSGTALRFGTPLPISTDEWPERFSLSSVTVCGTLDDLPMYLVLRSSNAPTLWATMGKEQVVSLINQAERALAALNQDTRSFRQSSLATLLVSFWEGDTLQPLTVSVSTIENTYFVGVKLQLSVSVMVAVALLTVDQIEAMIRKLKNGEEGECA